MSGHQTEDGHAIRSPHEHFPVHDGRRHELVTSAKLISVAACLVTIVKLIQSQGIVGVQYRWSTALYCPHNSVSSAIRGDAGCWTWVSKAGRCVGCGGR